MTKHNLTTEDIEYILSDDLLLKLSDSNLIVRFEDRVYA